MCTVLHFKPYHYSDNTAATYNTVWFIRWIPAAYIIWKINNYNSCNFNSFYEITYYTIYIVKSDLHWLPIRHRISFKLATITFKVLQFRQPSYLATLIPRYTPLRTLRSSSSLTICTPARKTAMAKSKSFSSAASDIWNKLPGHLSSIPALPAFRKGLKHHLFLKAYPSISSSSRDSSPVGNITFSDATSFINITPAGNTIPPG